MPLPQCGKIAVPDIELSVLIGNLLDNAMEACMKLPEEERFIRIYIDVIKKQLYICVTNSMDGMARRRGVLFSLTSREITVSGCCGSMRSWRIMADISTERQTTGCLRRR